MKPAPVALFVYNRPEHTRRTLEALRRNELAGQTDLFVFSDGPKTPAAAAPVAEVRALIQTVDGFRNVTVVTRERNHGLARSIIAGVSETVSSRGRVIVLEDDMVTSPYFLRYMNEALELYENEEDVISIHGYVYPVKQRLPETFFLRGADCWGWATWQRGWALFEPDGTRLLAELAERDLERDFDFGGTHGYTGMLRDQVEGRNDSWAVRWYASAFLRGKLTLYPGTSLVQNIGLDSSGTHCRSTSRFAIVLANRPPTLAKIAIEEDARARACFAAYFSGSASAPKKIAKAILRRLRCVLK